MNMFESSIYVAVSLQVNPYDNLATSVSTGLMGMVHTRGDKYFKTPNTCVSVLRTPRERAPLGVLKRRILQDDFFKSIRQHSFFRNSQGNPLVGGWQRAVSL